MNPLKQVTSDINRLSLAHQQSNAIDQGMCELIHNIHFTIDTQILIIYIVFKQFQTWKAY